ncbi:MAG: hypothetical protein M3268_02830, partial [Acidobacteriota bacterium]|nr:hypothetical protein [Acidobacteriota bacterium]
MSGRTVVERFVAQSREIMKNFGGVHRAPGLAHQSVKFGNPRETSTSVGILQTVRPTRLVSPAYQ